MYRVNEIFETIQGEGTFTGVPSVFVRLQGCPVGCAWCDTKQTWETDEKDQKDKIFIIDKSEDSPAWCWLDGNAITADILSRYHARHIVITGGEPCLYDLRPLTHALEAAGCQCQIETSGTYPIHASANTWVTVSPKINMRGKLPVLKEAMARANEVKHPVGTEKDIDQLDALLATCPPADTATIALQPVSQKARATQLCIDTCIQRGWRLSIQTHKYLSIA
ncbi:MULTISPECIES: 7-carboxy-7-deazaguanine synthase QueE [Salinivibrio]|uniref:7-carboxy-7-deazaguanine synthase n=1 Tax=Salinivibrio siamensis TaxID=414286 RepID=A0ABX3K7F3_9GAMM|nr:MULTISPECIES: 7-carboxy-7-deazaguanine synthase QueE [Salinivibrio]MPX90456.1 7-carboxy-7-deazaguanine synthase QueE [Salinivibrio sp. VYel1]OOE73047.1 7-carboxy-7-deazaguanine synthase QueE [Salinivibrio sp. ML290]OOE79126.1 7-carboxy-7-deazaguanine synthase QueE [Salinivibrio sp. PR6]OOE83818.1 7-carboxy-7-deazaguanine synthase QueE [Salinivibrio siamensis]